MFFVKFGCSFGIFLNSAHLICRSTDISKCFRGSLRLREHESRLYFPYFLSGLSIAYQINPYIKRNPEYISIQAFHYFKL